MTRAEAPTGWQAALIRGINVGKAKRVAMADLRTHVEALGYGGVRTLLNSGNVVYTAPGVAPAEAAAAIENVLAARIGVPARVIVLTAADIETILAENTLGDVADNPSRLFVTIYRDPADRAKVQPLLAQDWGAEKLAVGTRAAYQWLANGSTDSRLPDAVGKLLGDAATTRNWATMLKLQALAAEAG